MKKFLLCFFLLCVGFACEKPIICACIMPIDHFTLSIKNAAGDDMLDPKTPGAYLKQNIKVQYKQGPGKKTTDVWVKEPFTYGEGLSQKFASYTLVSSELGELSDFQKVNEFTLELGDGVVHVLIVDQQNGAVKVDGKQLEADKVLPQNMGKVYYLVKD